MFIIGYLDFNPRSLTGATTALVHALRGSRISIHAPSRERLKIFEPRNGMIAFQSTLPHGSDTGSAFAAVNLRRFQSTLPHGSDLILQRVYNIIDNFNPRSLTGATGLQGLELKQQAISIHAPSRERLSSILAPQILQIFQSTLPHGSDAVWRL